MSRFITAVDFRAGLRFPRVNVSTRHNAPAVQKSGGASLKWEGEEVQWEVKRNKTGKLREYYDKRRSKGKPCIVAIMA
jgi:pyrimidine deaminase RibD-like protein